MLIHPISECFATICSTGSSTNIDSIIYQWDFKKKMFVQAQSIPTVAAYDWTHFVVSGNHFLVVANAFNGRTTRVESVIYFWEDGKFVHFQSIEVFSVCFYEMNVSYSTFILIRINYIYSYLTDTGIHSFYCTNIQIC